MNFLLQVEQQDVGALIKVPKKKKIPGEVEGFFIKPVPISPDENAQEDPWLEIEPCNEELNATVVRHMYCNTSCIAPAGPMYRLDFCIADFWTYTRGLYEIIEKVLL